MIKNIMLLTKSSTLDYIKNFNLIDKKTKKLNKRSIYVWMIIIVALAMAFLSNYILGILRDYGQTEVFLDNIFAYMTLIMFMQVIILSMNILYFSKDIEYFLPLPIKPQELLLSKTNTILNVLYTTEIIFMLIPLILYGMSTTAGFTYYCTIFLVLLLLPIFPTILVSIIALIIMKFVKRIKNKNRFQTMITSFFMIIIMLIETFLIKWIMSDNVDYGQIDINLKTISQNINNTMVIVNPLIDILKQENIFGNLLKILALYIVMYGVLIYMGKRIYIKNILKTNTYSKSKSRKKINWESKCRQRSIIKSYMENDLKGLFRSAICFMQTVYPVCLATVMIIILSISFKYSLMQNNKEMFDLLNGLNLTIEGVAIILGVLQVLFSISNISISAISRQGKNAVFMKYIPISLYKQFILKNLLQVILNTIISIIVIVLSKVLFPNISIVQMLCLFVITTVVSILNSYLMLIVDIKRPILDWDTEIEVLKQNGNKIFQYVWTIIVVILLMYIAKAFKNINLYLAVLITFLIFAILLFIADKYVRVQIKRNKLFKNVI